MKMREQRLMGLVMVILSGWLLAWAFAGQTPEERDVTAVLLTLPLGLYMVYSDELIIYGDATTFPALPARCAGAGLLPSSWGKPREIYHTKQNERSRINGKEKSN